MEQLTSLKNEYIQLARSLKKSDFREKTGMILLEGEEIIFWAVKYGLHIDFIITSLSDTTSLKSITKTGTRLFSTSEGLMRKITSTSWLIPTVGVARPAKIKAHEDFVIVLDEVKDLGNRGTIVRTAAAFGINRIISTSKNTDMYLRKTIEASRGTVFNTDFVDFNSPSETIDYLKKKGYQIITTSPYGREIQSLVSLSRKPVALVVGNETSGASETLMQSSDTIIQIPMNTDVESLNVGVSTGISVYELKIKQVLTMIEAKIKSTLGRELNVTAMLMRKTLDRELAKVSHLTSMQLVFLMVLKCDSQMSKNSIQSQFGIPDNEFALFTTPLINNSLIVSSEDIFSITHKGSETIAKLWSIVEKTEKEILSVLNEAENEIFFSMLQKIKNRCAELI